MLQRYVRVDGPWCLVLSLLMMQTVTPCTWMLCRNESITDSMESTPIGLTCQERNNVNVNHSQQRDPFTAIAIEMVGCKRKAEQRFALKAGGVYFSTEIAYHCTRHCIAFRLALLGSRQV